jgi:hypothetical protein
LTAARCGSVSGCSAARCWSRWISSN